MRSRKFEEVAVVLVILLAVTVTASFTAWRAASDSLPDCRGPSR
jgi:hypothetical protein